MKFNLSLYNLLLNSLWTNKMCVALRRLHSIPPPAVSSIDQNTNAESRYSTKVIQRILSTNLGSILLLYDSLFTQLTYCRLCSRSILANGRYGYHFKIQMLGMTCLFFFKSVVFVRIQYVIHLYCISVVLKVTERDNRCHCCTAVGVQVGVDTPLRLGLIGTPLMVV